MSGMSKKPYVWRNVAGLVLAVGLAGCLGEPSGERAVTKGCNPSFSPDGAKIAFQRLEDDIFKVGVVGSRGGSVEWIEEGPGMAAYPAWTQTGGILYMYGHDTETAYEAWRGKSTNGYGLRLCEGGRKRDLTKGRCRDYTPCVSPDGKKIYFVTTRGVESESSAYSKAASTRIAELDLENGNHQSPTANCAF